MSHRRFLLLVGALIVVLLSLVMAEKDRPCLNQDGTLCLADGQVKQSGGGVIMGVGGGIPRGR